MTDSRNYKGYQLAPDGTRVAVYDDSGLLATFPDEDAAKQFIDRLYERETGGAA